MKLYESWFGGINFYRNFQRTVSFSLGAPCENRLPLENTEDYVLFKNGEKSSRLTTRRNWHIFHSEEVITVGGSISFQRGSVLSSTRTAG